MSAVGFAVIRLSRYNTVTYGLGISHNHISMSKKSEEFELMIARIHEILESESANVEWNDKIPDPDNPSQLRQIDVTVRNGEMFNIIECRIHKVKQDVKWIEELVGRRASLEADTVIAVSSSGFTSGAIKKAKKYGVILKDLVNLTDEDVLSWTKAIYINIIFYRYEEFYVKLVIDDIDGLSLDKLRTELQQYVGLNTIFTAHLNIPENKTNPLAEENRKKRFTFSTDFYIEDFYLVNRKVQGIETKGAFFLEEIQLTIPEHMAYGNPEDEGHLRDIYIQKYNLGNTRVIHRGEDISVSIDLSQMDIPPYWQFRYIEMDGGGVHNHECLELVCPEKVIMKVDKINLEITNIL